MKNVQMMVEGNILTIKVDLTNEFGPSSSGKTVIIATTVGSVSEPDGDEKIGLNVRMKVRRRVPSEQDRQRSQPPAEDALP